MIKNVTSVIYEVSMTFDSKFGHGFSYPWSRALASSLYGPELGFS